MGMFDHYEPDPPLNCPKCNARLDGWQGKDGPCALLSWKQGVKYPTDDTDFLAKGPARETLPEMFQIYTSCSNCKSWVEATCRGEGYAWTQTIITNARSQHQPARDK